MQESGFHIKRLALDGSYDVGAVHRGLELLGIEGDIPPIPFSNGLEQLGFSYLPDEDMFQCPMGKRLEYKRLYGIRSTGSGN